MSVTITVSDDGHVEAMHNSGRVLYDFTIDTDSDSVALADDPFVETSRLSDATISPTVATQVVRNDSRCEYI